jgi:ApaG protein
MYRAITHDIAVSVEPVYLDGQSEPDEGRYIWAYHIIIENSSNRTVQLQSRYWRIVDENGRVEEVRGPGVVGEQPILNPGDSYSYSSGCPLRTPSGTMVGRYQTGCAGREEGIELSLRLQTLPARTHISSSKTRRSLRFFRPQSSRRFLAP